MLKLNANENLDAIPNMQVTLVFPLAVYLVSSVIAINRITSIYAFFLILQSGVGEGEGINCIEGVTNHKEEIKTTLCAISLPPNHIIK